MNPVAETYLYGLVVGAVGFTLAGCLFSADAAIGSRQRKRAEAARIALLMFRCAIASVVWPMLLVVAAIKGLTWLHKTAEET